jgi:hypothetical protein
MEHQGLQKLQRFYVTDLGFDRVLLGYPWLSTFNPRINWRAGTVEGRVILKTVANAWIRWKEIRRATLVAQVQVQPITVNRAECEPELTFTEATDNEDWGAVVSRTNFAQDWA